MLTVYTGACGALTPVACDDDNGPSCAGANASLLLNAAATTNYYIMAGGYNSYSGNLTIMAGARPAISTVRSGSLLQFQWPSYYWPGYVLQRLTNYAGAGSSGAWADQLPNNYYAIYGITNPSAFFRLVTP